MELDHNVSWNPKPPGVGDYVIYSTRTGDVPYQTPGGIRGSHTVSGWYKANQSSTYKVQVRNAGTGLWETLNGGGAGVTVAVDEVCVFSEPKAPGDFRLVATFAVAPGVWATSGSITLASVVAPAAGG